MRKNFLIVLLFFISFLNADIVSTKVFYTYENNKFLNIDNVINKPELFKEFQLKKPLSFGYDAKHNIFVKLILKNNSNTTLDRVFVSKNPLVSKVIYYDKNGQKLDTQGFLQESENKSIYSSFAILLNPYEEKIYYISFESPFTTLIINLDMMDKKYYENWYFKNILYIALFFGGMLALCIYNLFVYFATKDKAYLFYTLCILATTFHHSAYTGVLFLFANIEYTTLTFKYSAIIVSLPMYFLGVFSKYYLETKNFSKINTTINIFLIVIPLSWVFFIMFPEYSKFRNLLSFIFLFYLLSIAIYLAYKKVQQSYYVIAGWFLFFLSGIFMMLSSSGAYDIFIHYPHIVEFLLFTEAILFSIALSNRIRSLQNQVITLKNKREQELKIEVEEKTKKLSKSLKEKQLLLKELNHRVKNNMQMILSLIRLQSKESNTKELTTALLTIEGRISALGHLHELLYRQDNVLSIKAEDYFELLIDDLVRSYDTTSQNITFSFNLKGSLFASHAIYCGLIINELITNSLKYAFDNKEGEITIFFEEQKENFVLKYSDNGIGYEPVEKSESLGMLIVTTLAQVQLEGDLKIDSTNGTNITLVWNKDLKNE
jgi:two-component sensor histidine kinase